MALHTARESGPRARRRTAKGWTQEDLAAQVGVSRDWVSDLERAPRTPVSISCFAASRFSPRFRPHPQLVLHPESTDLDAVLSRHRGR